jgi:hypothetical protein
MARDFAGLRETAAVEAIARETVSATQARAQRARRQSEGQKSREWIGTAMGVIADSYPDDASAPLRTSDELSRDLDVPKLKKAATGGDEAAALEARRRLNELEVQLGYYLPSEALRKSALARARYYLSTALLIDGRAPVTLFMLSETHAYLNARRDAVDALRRAIDAGFRDLALVQSDPAFRRLRSDPAFATLVERLRSAGDALDLLIVDRPPPVPVR